MTKEEKEWIPIYGIFVIPSPNNRTAHRGFAFGIYHAAWMVVTANTILKFFNII